MKDIEIRAMGGIPVRSVDLTDAAEQCQLLGREPYCYELLTLAAGESWRSDKRARYCIYVLTVGTSVCINEITVPMDFYVLGETERIEIVSAAGAAQILLASQQVDICRDPLRQVRLEDAKKVDKPWGYEIWLTGDPSPVFAFKRILLKAGNRTSLQYHRHKRETNFIIYGEANLHFSSRENVPAELVTTDMIASMALTGPVVADVFPGLVHRLEAYTDLTLFEVSTPELDDVFRIHDESGRAHGRIHHEHG